MSAVHLRVGNNWLTEFPRCGVAAAQGPRHVLATQDATLVTCKRCLRMMAKETEQELLRLKKLATKEEANLRLAKAIWPRAYS